MVGFQPDPDIDSYEIHEREWDSYEELYETFEWDVPETFNFATYACDRWAADHGRIALYGGGPGVEDRAYTYRQLQWIVNRLANYFRDQGIERGDRIGINTPQKPETAMAHLAAWKMGAISIPASTLYGPDALGYRFGDAGVDAVVADEKNIDAVREVKSDLDLAALLTVDESDPEADERDFWAVQGDYSANFETVEADPVDTLLVLYTSGTTGQPKGVVIPHQSMLGQLPGYIASHLDLEVNEDDTIWTPVEWAWSGTITVTMGPALYLGRPVVAYYTAESFDPASAFEVIDRYGVTAMFTPATALRMMMQVASPTDDYDVDTLRSISSGGESLGDDVANWADWTFAGATVHELFGQTEAPNIVGEISKLFPRQEGAVGKPIPGFEVALLDEETAEPTIPVGDVGEFAFRYEDNPIAFTEYWGMPERTAETLKNGWLRTGDLGRRDEDGYYYYVGRKDDVIITSGYRVGPDEVEDNVSSHEAVVDTGVIGVPHDERGKIVKAFVTLADGYEPSESLRTELQEHVKERGAKYAYPREIKFVDELPRTVTGKIRRVELREREGVDE